MNRLKTTHENLVQTNRILSLESETIKKLFKDEETSIYKIIDIISEIELEFELIGRNQKSLNYVMEKLSSKLDSFGFNRDSFYMLSLKNILLHLYKNQLKWCQSIPHYSLIDVNTSESTDDEDFNKIQMKITENEIRYENEAENNSGSEDSSLVNTFEEFSSDLLDKTLVDDIDIDSINYILMNKSFNHNIHSNLDVVNEEEEEEVTYERDIEEETGEGKEIMKTTNSEVYGFDITESIIKQVLYEIIDIIDKSFNERQIENNNNENELIHKKFRKPDENATFAEDIESYSSGCALNDDSVQCLSQINKSQYIEKNVITDDNSQVNNEKLIDSAFVSEDNCSSPEATHCTEKSTDFTVDNSEKIHVCIL